MRWPARSTVIARYCRRARALGAERIRRRRDQRGSRRREPRGARGRRPRADREPTGGHRPGEQEAALTFLGGTRGLDPRRRRPLPGAWTSAAGPRSSSSGATGARARDLDADGERSADRAARADRPADAEDDSRPFDAEIDAVLDEVEDRCPSHDARTLVAVAGTATTVQAIALGSTRTTPTGSTVPGSPARTPSGPRRLARDDERRARRSRHGARTRRRDRGGGA